MSNDLYFSVLAITAFFALIVVGIVVYFAIKYRNDTAETLGPPITGWVPL